jgi:hypothetical protein
MRPYNLGGDFTLALLKSSSADEECEKVSQSIKISTAARLIDDIVFDTIKKLVFSIKMSARV